jgi:hypothetical protein
VPAAVISTVVMVVAVVLLCIPRMWKRNIHGLSAR